MAETDALAPAWGGAPVSRQVDGRVYRLDEVTPPARVSGTMRPAGPDDQDLLLAWTVAFHREVALAGEAGPDETWRRSLEPRVAEGRAFVWDDAGPVFYVGTTHQVAGVVRVAPVYTTPACRRRGYASALVAAVSQAALDEGAVASMLYTDLADPTSNKIYTAVGYRPVADVRTYRFGGSPRRPDVTPVRRERRVRDGRVRWSGTSAEPGTWPSISTGVFQSGMSVGYVALGPGSSPASHHLIGSLFAPTAQLRARRPRRLPVELERLPDSGRFRHVVSV